MSSGASALAPLAPWALAGESIVGLARWQGGATGVPGRARRGCRGLRSSPRPATPTRRSDAFVELIIGHPARLGLRFGWMISESIVTAEDARIGGRLNWGFPSERADLPLGGRRPHACARVAIPRVLDAGRAEGRAVSVARAGARAAASQRRLRDRPRSPDVGERGSSCLRSRRSPTIVLNAVAGAHPGAMVSGLRATVHPARAPLGLAKSLVAPSEGARACGMV